MITDIFEINRRICFNLWDMVDVHSEPRGLSPRLILPEKRNKATRISEQESRILYCGLLNTLNYYYSIETPTEKTYMQLGTKRMSASSDLSLYRHDGGAFKKVMNVEFKAHNPPFNHKGGPSCRNCFEKQWGRPFILDNLVGRPSSPP